MEYYWIGHCKEGTSDKVWGMIDLGHSELYPHYPDARRFVTFWGARGKTLRSKVFDADYYEADALYQAKERRGYVAVNKNRLDEVYPEFEEDLEKTAVWAMLKG